MSRPVCRSRPHLNRVVAFHAEDEVGKSGDRPCPEPGDAQLVGETQRPVVRMPADVGDGPLDGIDEPTGNGVAGFLSIVLGGRLNILGSDLA